MFRFTRKPSSGSHSQYLAKITHLVQRRYIELVQDVVSVMAAGFLDNRHTKVVGLSALRTGHLYPQEYPGTYF
jgi:hypothetical protein